MTTGETKRSAEHDLRHALTQGSLLGAWIAALGLAAYVVVLHISTGSLGMDSHAYWVAGHAAHPYQASPGSKDAFLYSPLFAQVVRPVSLLPWPAFCGVWLVAEGATFVWLLRPLPWQWRFPALAFVVPEVLVGNIHGMIAVAVVVGLQRPGMWAFPLLTKVSPAAPGAVWFAARGDWRKVAKAAGVTLALVTLSFSLEPNLWLEWVRFLFAHGGHGMGTFVRTALGLALTIYAARRNRPWLLPIAIWLSLPMSGFEPHSLAVLAAVPRLARPRQSVTGLKARD